MVKWEYIELRNYRTSIQFTPANKVDEQDIKNYFSKWTSARFENNKYGHLDITLPDTTVQPGFIAASDYLGRLGWEAFGTEQSDMGTFIFFKRELRDE